MTFVELPMKSFNWFIDI